MYLKSRFFNRPTSTTYNSNLSLPSTACSFPGPGVVGHSLHFHVTGTTWAGACPEVASNGRTIHRNDRGNGHRITFHKTQAECIPTPLFQNQMPKVTTASPLKEASPLKRGRDRREVRVGRDSRLQQRQRSQSHDHVNTLARLCPHPWRDSWSERSSSISFICFCLCSML